VFVGFDIGAQRLEQGSGTDEFGINNFEITLGPTLKIYLSDPMFPGEDEQKCAERRKRPQQGSQQDGDIP
jgi:hypothetical protein